jgi:serine/threonine-protein phosphatase 2B regulatory subunit
VGRMGQIPSQLLEEEVEELSKESLLSTTEIKRLYKRFKTLDKDRKNSISFMEFLSIPELSMNPLANRILVVFDKSKKQELNFKEFIDNLSVFSIKTPREKKLKFAFDVYDVDLDGYISKDDLLYIIKLLVGSNLNDDQVISLVDQTILDADTLDMDGKISFQEFKRSMFDVDFSSILTIEF